MTTLQLSIWLDLWWDPGNIEKLIPLLQKRSWVRFNKPLRRATNRQWAVCLCDVAQKMYGWAEKDLVDSMLEYYGQKPPADV